MARIEEARARFERVADRLWSDRKAFAKYLEFSGRFYKLPSARTMAIFDENSNAQMVAEYDTWKRFGRQVKSGAASMAVLTENGTAHYFDISQTVGEKIPYQWTLDKNTAKQLAKTLSQAENREFKTVSRCVDYLSVKTTNQSINAYADSLNIPAEKRAEFALSLCSMVKRVVAARCGYRSSFSYNGAELDLSALDMLHSKAEMTRLMECVQITAKSALLTIEKSMNEILERSIDNGRNQGDERQNVPSGRGNEGLARNSGNGSDRGRTGADERADRSLRERVEDVYGNELSGGYSSASGQPSMGADTSSNRARSASDDGEHQGGVLENKSAPDDDILGDSAVGERAENDNRTADSGGFGSGSQSVNENDKTAEDNSPAVSVSEFVDIALYSLYENSAVRNAHENSDKQEFALETEKAINDYFTQLVTGEEYSEYYSADEIAPLYNKFQQDGEFKSEIVSTITERLDKELIRLEQAKQKAEEMGIPFSDRYHNEDEEFDPYAYDGSMSVEDSLKVADANNLREFMLDYSDELSNAAMLTTPDEFRKLFADRAGEALRDYSKAHSNVNWHNGMLNSNPDYFNSVCDLVSASLYNELRDENILEKSFAEQVDASLNGTLPFYTSLKVCDTPDILLKVGLKQLPMLYTQKHLKDAIAQRDDIKHKHGLTIEQIKNIPDKLKKPIMIYDSFSRNDSVVAVVNDFDKDDNPIIVSIKPDGTGRYEIEEIKSNFVTSIYSKENFKETFARAINEDKLLFCDKKQTQEMFERWGLQLPELTNSLVFNTIIHQSSNIVNSFSGKNTQKSENFSEDKGGATYITEITAYRVGDFYEFFNEDAQKTSELLGLAKTSRQGIPMTGVPAHIFEDYKGKLAAQGYDLKIGDNQELKKILNIKQLGGAEYRERAETASQEAPYVTVSPFSKVDFSKIGLDSDKRYSIPEFNEALANADRLYTADESNSMRVDTIAVTLHIGDKEYTYRPILGAEYGALSAIMDDTSLVNSSNISVTAQTKALVSEIESKAQKAEIDERAEPETEEIKDEAQEKSTANSTTSNAETEGGAKAKFAANIAAIKTLKAIESENRLATPDEQDIFSRYTDRNSIARKLLTQITRSGKLSTISSANR